LIGLPALPAGGVSDLVVLGSRFSFEGVFLPDLRDARSGCPC
jgi:hypothetical protein